LLLDRRRGRYRKCECRRHGQPRHLSRSGGPADAVVETRLRKPLSPGLQVIRDPESLIGMVAARTILPKRLIAPSALREAYAIEAGQPTTVYYRDGALVIAMDGVALQSANIGKPIRIRNTQSNRTISGIVMPDGTVSVEAR
jgi:flagella basal body P-ring formation protein FlgA